MKLSFNQQLALTYKSPSQKIRVLTEQWVGNSIFCPNCGYDKIENYPNNQPVADFYCSNCNEDYELKSKQNSYNLKIVDGAHHTMLERLNSNNNPNLLLLNYDSINLEVTNFLVIPKHYFVSEIIEKRKPLSHTARRAGWIGCNILLNLIPQSGKIFFIRNRKVLQKEKVVSAWKRTLFLREEEGVSIKNWLLDVMRIVEKLNKSEFTLNEVYAFENELTSLHPENKHIKDKIRQQLQLLRDKGYLKFISRGYYRLT